MPKKKIKKKLDNEDMVFIEEFQGLDIYYNKASEKFVATNEETHRHYAARYLFEMKDAIDGDGWEADTTKKGFIKDGIFTDEIYSLQSVMVNRNTGQVRWKRMKATGDGYDIGKDFPNTSFDHKTTIYPVSKYNIEVWKDAVEKHKASELARMELQNAVGRLSMKEK